MDENKAPHPRSVKGLEHRSGISERTIRSHIAHGTLEVTRIGGRIIITEEQEALWFFRLRDTKRGRSYDEKRYLESIGFGRAFNA